MALTSVELQLLENLQRKQIADLQRPNSAPQATSPLDMGAISSLIDQKVAERLQSYISAPTQQSPQPQQQNPLQMKTQENAPMLTLKSQDKALLERLRPLFMGALTLEQKGKLAELAFAVHTQANSTEHAYRVGFDAFCEFLTTPTGREWIQVGTNAFFQALEPQAQVPSSIGVNTK